MEGDPDVTPLEEVLHVDHSHEENDECIFGSQYYDLDTFKNLVRRTNFKNHISILNANARSLQAHLDQYSALLHYIHDGTDFQFDVLTFEETWLNDNITPMVSMDNYSLVTKHKISQRIGGGLAIYVKSHLNFIERSDLKMPTIYQDIFDCSFIEIVSEMSTCKNLIIGLVYRSPSHDSIEAFTECLNDILGKISKENKDVALLGDTNIDLLKVDRHAATGKYFDQIMNYGMTPQITVPTRQTHETATLIDHVFLNSKSNGTAGTIKSDITDHFINFLFVNHTKNSKPKYVSYRPFTEKNIKKLNDSLDHCDMTSIYNSDNPDTAYASLISLYNSNLDKHIPIKTTKFNKYKHKFEPWITKGILQSIKQRDILYNKLYKAKNTHRHQILETQYTEHKRILNKLLRQAKHMYYNNKIMESKQDSKKMWENINNILKRTRNKLDFPDKFYNEDVTLTDLKDIANGFNKFYTNIGPKLASQIDTSDTPNINPQFKSIANSFYFYPTDDQEITRIIRLLKPKTSTGHDGISPKLLTQTCKPLIKPLVSIINLSLQTGIVPSDMKKAKVIPIYKSGDKHHIKNYRPISLLPVLSKIMERVVYNRLYKFITQNSLLTVCQYGFREDLSTELAILELQDRIANAIDYKLCCAGIFLDLSKAFDTLDHAILLTKLQKCGVRGLALSWFQSYLCGRTQYVDYNGTKSDVHEITCGVPQGSILGPLLFLIYINDLPQISKIGSNILFADDTNILYTAPNYTTLRNTINKDLIIISAWFKLNKLSVNVSKTKCVVFHTRRSRPPDDWHIILNDNILETVDQIKFLGVIFHKNLSWEPHLHNVCNKISKSTAILAKVKHMVPQLIMRTIYNSLVLPHMSYALVAWGNSPASHLDRITKLQKKAIRHMTKSKYNSHTEPLFKAQKLLKLSDLYYNNCCKIQFKNKSNKLPYYHSSKLTPVELTHDRPTRQARNLHTNRIYSEMGKQTINFKISSVWNSLPNHLKVLNVTDKTFSFSVKKYLLQSYEEVCTTRYCYICTRTLQN